MKVLSVLAQKGGAGKTTLALHWAVEAAQKWGDKVAVIDTDTQRSAASWAQRREANAPVVLEADEDNLSQALEACHSAKMKFVIIDTMPRVEWSSVQAAKVADLVVIPAGPTVVDIEAIGKTVAIVAQEKRAGAIVINQGRPGSSINDKAAKVLGQYDLPVCPVQIMRRAALSDAFTDGRAVRELSPRSKGASEITKSLQWLLKQMKGN